MRLERRQALWLPIVLLHALLLLASLPRPAPHQPASDARLIVHLLPAPTPPRRAAPERRPAPQLPARAQGPADPRPAPRANAPAQASDTAAAAAAAETPQPEPVATAPADASPAPVPLLQTEATRQAIRLATRAPLLSERAASASEAPARETAQQRFGREVARTAHGNCLKGEFPGAGAGLLSLPMFLIAEASGRCQK